MRILTLIGAISLFTFFGCSNEEPTIVPQPAGTTLTLNLNGLEDLGTDALYEGWIIVNGSPLSTGTFSVDANGNLSKTEFDIDATDLSTATAFILTIEPNPDPDPNPSAVHILAGDFSGNSSNVTVNHSAALGSDFMSSTGVYILATPTDGAMTNENSGIWFLDLTSGSPSQGLFLPILPSGWKYEGWTVINGTPVSTGTFIDATVIDDADPYSNTMPGPPFPGEDFLVNAPTGLTFPTDIAGGVAVISIEPSPDNSANPFTLKPLVGDIPMNAVDHATYMMNANLSSFPTGTVSR